MRPRVVAMVSDRLRGLGTQAIVVRGLCLMAVTALGLSTSACTVVGFATGVAIADNREARLNAKATYAEHEACRARRKEQAFALTKTAIRAARTGDCTSTIAIEHQVRDLDVNVHDAWFVRDDAIKICLDPPPVGPPVAPAQSADELPGCTDRELRAARTAQPQPSHGGTIAGWAVAGLVIDIVVTVVAFVAVADL